MTATRDWGGLRPRQTVHHGSVLASGLLVDPRRAGEQAARVRLLRQRHAGLTVFRREGQLVARFREPVRLEAESAPGAPLVGYASLLSTTPLDPDEVSTLDASRPAIVLVVGGVAALASLEPSEDGEREDLESWLDVSRFLVKMKTTSLGKVSPEPEAREPTAASDVRGLLGIPKLSSGAAQLVEQLSRRHANAEPTRLTTRAGLARALVAAASVARRLMSLFARGAARAALRGSGRELAVSPVAPPTGPSWLEKAAALLRSAVARALVWSRLASWFAGQHARYFARMLEMFEEGNLEEALHLAIPLSEKVHAALSSPALLPPARRTELAIVPHRARATTSVGLQEDLFSVLKRAYRRAFERLEAAGDIEKAAFVLAELLGASEEAVSFLERHGRWTLAAEIAEARGLPPGLVVRQWFLAGERDRAIQVARRTGAFADAVVRLESSHKEHATALRLLWASSLAEGGAYAAAVDLVWLLPAARGIVMAWVERAILVGGGTGARMLVRKARLSPSTLGDVSDAVRAILADDGEDGRRVALVLAREILDGAPDGATRVLAKLTARSMLASDGDPEGERLGERLVHASGDSLLRADVLACGPQQPASKRRDRATPAVDVRAFAVTDVGMKRLHNEDMALATSLANAFAAPSRLAVEGNVVSDGVLLGVFDGAGGSSSGDFASALVRASVYDVMQREFAEHGSDEDGWARALGRAIDAANRELWRETSTNPRRRGAGCAATVATLCASTLLVAQVGDTRAYLLRDGELRQITTDHSLLNDCIAKKMLTVEEIEAFPHKNVIVRCLGMNEAVAPDVIRVALLRGDVILLASDGLHGVVSDAGIRDLLLERAPHQACEALKAAALEGGAPDNLSIVVATMSGAGLGNAALPIHAELLDLTTSISKSQVSGRTISLQSLATPTRIRRVKADVGAHVVWDAAELPDGRMLVALGEVGVWLLAKDGRVLVRFGQPAETLVMSDHGDRAILAIRRGEVMRLARLDLVTNRVRPWCDARIDEFAPDFDGSCWYVGVDRTVYAIAATADGWEHDWKLEHSRVWRLHRDEKSVSVMFGDAPGCEVWTLEAGSRTLRMRREPSEAMVSPGAIGADGQLMGWRNGAGELNPGLVTHEQFRDFVVQAPGQLSGRVRLTREWIALPVSCSHGTNVHLCDMAELRERAVVELERVERAAARLQGDRAVICDDRGRVLVLSLRDGSVIREFRVS